MAQLCGVTDILAEYGRNISPENYSELVKITYWTSDKIDEEEWLRNLPVVPRYTVSSFPEVFDLIRTAEAKNGLLGRTK